MKKKKLKGFTLIEIIVVIAILGILMAILVPSFIGYLRRAKRTSDIASAKEIHNNVNHIITENKPITWYSSSGKANVKTNAMQSFYSKSGSSYKNIARGGNSKFNKIDENGKPYTIMPVAVLDATTDSKWKNIDQEQIPFVEELNAQMCGSSGTIEIPIKYEPKDDKEGLDRWFICYRVDDPSRIEIWVGVKYGRNSGDTGGSGTPMYRVYPNAVY